MRGARLREIRGREEAEDNIGPAVGRWWGEERRGGRRATMLAHIIYVEDFDCVIDHALGVGSGDS